ncbi:cytochrome c biogenesis protein CcdA [Marisediminicola sp. UYEF4]|uniref:DUF4190 domain-containing protein n=1 Tax=Marisediminicola sp. UYEF4 TaxID=1756384 RepID=UPI003390CB7D
MRWDTDFPGRKLGVVGLILSCLLGVVGLVVSTIALVTSLRAQQRNVPAIAGIVIGIVGTVVFAAGAWYFFEFWEGNVGPCADREAGVYEDGIYTYSCE